MNRQIGPDRVNAVARLAYAIVVIGGAASSFANTLLTGSLHIIAEDLDSTIAVVSWIQVGPFLVFAVGLPIFGKLCDLIGTRQVYLGGLALSLTGNALLVIAPGVYLAIACRTLAQIGTAAVMPGGFKVVAMLFDGEERSRRIGAFNATTALSPVLGVGLGAPLIASVGWRAPFAMQSVLLGLALVAAFFALPDTARAERVRFDFAGAWLLAIGVGSSLFAINRVRAWGPLHPAIVAIAVVGPTLLVILAQVERRRAEPLMPMQYLALPDFRRLLGAASLNSAGYFGSTIAAPIILTRLFGFTDSAALYVIMVRPFTWAMGSFTAPRVGFRYSARRIQVVCNVMQMLALLLASVAVGRHLLVVFVFALAWHGYASGAAQVSVLSLVASTVAAADAGIGNGVLSMGSMIGTATGTTLMSVLISDADRAQPFVFAFAVGAAISGLVACISARLGHEARAR